MNEIWCFWSNAESNYGLLAYDRALQQIRWGQYLPWHMMHPPARLKHFVVTQKTTTHITFILFVSPVSTAKRSTLNSAYNWIGRTENFSFAGKCRHMQVKIWMFRTPDPLNRKTFPLKTSFLEAQMPINPLKTKGRLHYLKTQFVPRSKHFSSRL